MEEAGRVGDGAGKRASGCGVLCSKQVGRNAWQTGTWKEGPLHTAQNPSPQAHAPAAVAVLDAGLLFLHMEVALAA